MTHSCTVNNYSTSRQRDTGLDWRNVACLFPCDIILCACAWLCLLAPPFLLRLSLPSNSPTVYLHEWLKVGRVCSQRQYYEESYLTLNAAPAVNETLTPDDAVDVLEELLPAQNKSYELELKLKLPQHVVEAIHSKELPPDKYLLKVLIKFLQQTEPRPTWGVIVEALRSPAVNLPALARRVEAAHFPDPTATRNVVAETTGMSPSALLICDWCS